MELSNQLVDRRSFRFLVFGNHAELFIEEDRPIVVIKERDGGLTIESTRTIIKPCDLIGIRIWMLTRHNFTQSSSQLILWPINDCCYPIMGPGSISGGPRFIAPVLEVGMLQFTVYG